ncbi:MAG TPA: putative quinol monooxygenase [Hyphomicrobiaceae bacterium]|nr:putative quinol monooxygenase [Hyphomicrobiaceae bacterium]
MGSCGCCPAAGSWQATIGSTAGAADVGDHSCEGAGTTQLARENAHARHPRLSDDQAWPKPGKETEFKEQMTVQAKRCLANEIGCLQFGVVQDPKAPTRFVMLEIYQDDDAIKAHQESEHFKDFRPVIGELLADRKIEIFTMVSDGKTKRE